MSESGSRDRRAGEGRVPAERQPVRCRPGGARARAHRIRRWRRAGRREPSPLRLRHGPAAV